MGILNSLGYVKLSTVKAEIDRLRKNAKAANKMNQQLLIKNHDLEKIIARQEIEIETFQKLLGEATMKHQETEKSLDMAKRIMKDSSFNNVFSSIEEKDE